MIDSGHVQVIGREIDVDHATLIIDSLIDGDGSLAAKRLAPLLLGAATGESGVDCPASLVGHVIGPKGSRILKIKEQAGVHRIEYSKETGKFVVTGTPGQCRLAVKLIEHAMSVRMSMNDFVGFIDLPSPVVGRIIGKGGEGIRKIKEQTSASRIQFEPLPSVKGTSRAEISAPSEEAAIRCARAILKAVPQDSSISIVSARLEDWSAMASALAGESSSGSGGRQSPSEQQPKLTPNTTALLAVPDDGSEARADASKAEVFEAHRRHYARQHGTLEPGNAKDLAASDFELWSWAWAVMHKPVWEFPKGSLQPFR